MASPFEPCQRTATSSLKAATDHSRTHNFTFQILYKVRSRGSPEIGQEKGGAGLVSEADTDVNALVPLTRPRNSVIDLPGPQGSRFWTRLSAQCCMNLHEALDPNGVIG